LCYRIATGDKLFTGVNDTGDNTLSRVLIDSMTPEINLSPVTTTEAIIITGGNYTGDKTIERISACLHLKMNVLKNSV
jgi:hypothetical protein